MRRSNCSGLSKVQLKVLDGSCTMQQLIYNGYTVVTWRGSVSNVFEFGDGFTMLLAKSTTQHAYGFNVAKSRVTLLICCGMHQKIASCCCATRIHRESKARCFYQSNFLP